MLSLRTCLLLSLAACGPKPPQTETTDGDTSTGDTGPGSTSAPTTAVDPTTGAVGSTGADTSGGGFMLPPDEGGGFIVPNDGGGCIQAGPHGQLRCSQCDPWQQGTCPEGQKCSPYASGFGSWDALRCVPLDPDPDHIGEPCTVEGDNTSGIDSCDAATMCWFVDPMTLTGVCVPRCTGSPDNPMCAESTACDITNDGVLTLCLSTCDPLLVDCPAGQICIFSQTSSDFICDFDASGDGGQLFDACEWLNACDPGLLCTEAANASECDPNAAGCCLPYCDLTAPPACPGSMQECLPWFGMDQAPPHLANVGMCGLPQ